MKHNESFSNYNLIKKKNQGVITIICDNSCNNCILSIPHEAITICKTLQRDENVFCVIHPNTSWTNFGPGEVKNFEYVDAADIIKKDQKATTTHKHKQLTVNLKLLKTFFHTYPTDINMDNPQTIINWRYVQFKVSSWRGDYIVPPIINWNLMDYMEFLQTAFITKNNDYFLKLAFEYGESGYIVRAENTINLELRCKTCGLFGHGPETCRPRTLPRGLIDDALKLVGKHTSLSQQPETE